MPIMSGGAYTPPSWLLYERSVAQVLAQIDPDAVVEHHVRVRGRLSGRLREVDVRVTGTVAGCTVVIAGECKHLREPVGMDVVEEHLAKLEDIGADLGLLVSSSGFTEPARRRAMSSYCPRLLLQQFPFTVDAALMTLTDMQRRYVDLHLALGGDLDDRQAWNLSRQYDESARELRELGSSGAEALTAHGLL